MGTDTLREKHGNVDNTEKLPAVISFCSGYGGLERGLDLAGFKHRVLAYVEIEAYAAANLIAKMEQGELVPAPVWTDLKTFPAHLFRGKVDLITGGYPCQPFSTAGKQLGDKDPRHLWPFIKGHIRTIKPIQCLFENVEGHISNGLQQVVEELEEAGYETAWGIFSASEAGAPHRRKRVFLMGNTNSTFIKGERISSGVGEKHTNLNSRSPEVRREAPQQWASEPSVGRVANGCPNQLDRLKLLGNGVVPQTAAVAWKTLNKELEG